MTVGALHFGIDVVVPQIMAIGMLRTPNEACGIVVPDLNLPPDEWVRELANRSLDPLNSYEIDPETIKSLVKQALWGDVLVWHTHPGGQVGPSRNDMRSRIPGLRYLVVSLPRGEPSLF